MGKWFKATAVVVVALFSVLNDFGGGGVGFETAEPSKTSSKTDVEAPTSSILKFVVVDDVGVIDAPLFILPAVQLNFT